MNQEPKKYTEEEKSYYMGLFKDRLEHSILHLVSSQQYYANLLYQMTIVPDFTMPSAGITIKNELIMKINPEFFVTKTPQVSIGILMHELDHVLHRHILRGQIANMDMQHMNIAADISINQHNKYLKNFEDCLHLEVINKKEGLHMAPKREMEYYAKALKDEGIVQYAPMDSHEGWASAEDSEFAKEVVKSALQKAVDATESGKVPGAAIDSISKLSESKVSWRKVLRQFVQRVQDIRYKTTRNRRNRRTGLKDPGKRQLHKLNIVCCVDTSGSVGIEELRQFSAELTKLKKLGASIKIVEYDHDVQAVYDLEKSHKWEFKGRGGTSHAAGLVEAAKHGPDAVFVFTDGDPADVPSKYKIPTLWVLSSKSAKNPSSFGRTIHVDVNS